MFKSLEDFEREIEAQRAKLGREVHHAPTENDDLAGIRCDFELPYSTLPKLQGKRWFGERQLG